MTTVRIGCTLPQGMRLDLYPPVDALASLGNPMPTASVTLNGTSTGQTRDATSGAAFTDIDASFWASFIAANPTFPPLVSGAIFPTS